MESYCAVRCFVNPFLYGMTSVIECFTFKMVGTNMGSDAMMREMSISEGKGTFYICYHPQLASLFSEA